MVAFSAVSIILCLEVALAMPILRGVQFPVLTLPFGPAVSTVPVCNQVSRKAKWGGNAYGVFGYELMHELVKVEIGRARSQPRRRFPSRSRCMVVEL